jgi:hypothetical protein
MLGKCSTFFGELTASIISGNQVNKTMNRLCNVCKEDTGESLLQDNYLYSDAYRLNLKKLIPPVQQEKLKEVYGEEWLKIVSDIYKEIEREIHDDIVNKFSGQNTFINGEMNNE